MMGCWRILNSGSLRLADAIWRTWVSSQVSMNSSSAGNVKLVETVLRTKSLKIESDGSSRERFQYVGMAIVTTERTGLLTVQLTNRCPGRITGHHPQRNMLKHFLWRPRPPAPAPTSFLRRRRDDARPVQPGLRPGRGRETGLPRRPACRRSRGGDRDSAHSVLAGSGPTRPDTARHEVSTARAAAALSNVASHRVLVDADSQRWDQLTRLTSAASRAPGTSWA